MSILMHIYVIQERVGQNAAYFYSRDSNTFNCSIIFYCKNIAQFILIEIWVLPPSQLTFDNMLLCTLIHILQITQISGFLLEIVLEVELLSHKVTYIQLYTGFPNISSKCSFNLYYYESSFYKISVFQHYSFWGTNFSKKIFLLPGFLKQLCLKAPKKFLHV